MNNNNLVNVATVILTNNLNVKKHEQLLIVVDEHKTDIGELFYEAGTEMGVETVVVQFASREKSGIEPPHLVAEAMKEADVAICITEESISHTMARKNAADNMTRVATMPNGNVGLLSRNAFSANYDVLMERGKVLSNVMNEGTEATITTGEHSLTFHIKDRKSKVSTGFLREPGNAGNLPSGEVFLAPQEGTANGSILIDGSIAGIGLLMEPVLLEVKDGLLVSASGEAGRKLLEILGDGDGRNLAEFGVGINEAAKVTGNVLEDEKVLGTCHVAFGTNNTFGGVVDAGVHIDAVTKDPEITIDGQDVLKLIK